MRRRHRSLALPPGAGAQLVRVPGLGRRAEHPGLELVVERVAPGLERPDLGGQRAVVEQDRGVGQADRRLGQVLQLHQDVNRAVELGQRRGVVVPGIGSRGRAGELAERVTPSSGRASAGRRLRSTRRGRGRLTRSSFGSPHPMPVLQSAANSRSARTSRLRCSDLTRAASRRVPEGRPSPSGIRGVPRLTARCLEAASPIF